VSSSSRRRGGAHLLRSRPMAQPVFAVVAGWGDPSWPEPFMGRNERLLTACAWCGSIKIGARWVWQNAAIRELRTFEWPEPPVFTYVVCDRCAAVLAEDETGR
jgi:hypothetical protein